MISCPVAATRRILIKFCLFIQKMQSPRAKRLPPDLRYGGWLILLSVFGGGKLQLWVPLFASFHKHTVGTAILPPGARSGPESVKWLNTGHFWLINRQTFHLQCSSVSLCCVVHARLMPATIKLPPSCEASFSLIPSLDELSLSLCHCNVLCSFKHMGV